MRNKLALMGTTALLGSMTPAERQKGRFMRAPDHGADEFAEFEAAGEVEVGKSQTDATEEPEKKTAPKKPAERKTEPAPKEAAPEPDDDDPDEPGEEDDDADQPGEEDDDEDADKKPKPKPKASDRIRELNRRLRQEERLRLASDARLDALEKSLLPGTKNAGNSADEIGAAPDPQDSDKYPLGHLDDRYIEDKLEWLATKKAAERADAVLQRQQENERGQQQQQQHEALLAKVDDLAARGSELYDDYQETVVDAGMKGEWRLEQATFEAAHEAENGHQILYELSKDKKEAKRVAELSPYQQMKFVMERDAEISAKSKPRRIPGAGAPPATQTRGANSRTTIRPDTDNLNDFEKAWEQDAKKSS